MSTRVTRGLRRIRARWRLHRIEWAAMHAPLHPPPGYEEDVSLRSAFPGLRSTPPIRSAPHFREVAVLAWRLYRHQYVSDPEIAAAEAAAEAKEAHRRRRRDERRREYERRALAEGRELAAVAHDKLPDSTTALENRLDVLNVSLEQFMLGFTETSTGATTLFGERPYQDAVVDRGNAPVVYNVVKAAVEGEGGDARGG